MRLTHITLIALFSCTTLLGQSFADNLTQIREIPTTPTMWEFEKYGNYPVSMHTGLPQISIPLYTAKSGQIEVPVSLSYHASGIKVDQKASWAGLGWSVMAGGAITRTIRGSADEFTRGYINYNFYDQGVFDPSFSNNYYETEEMLQGFIDTEPDIFQYNFMGYSGRFVFEPDTGTGNPIIALIPHNDLKVVPVFVGNSLNSFTVTTPEGYVAEFAYPESSSEYRPAGLIGAFTVTAKTAWHLKKITAPNGIDEITFQYKTLGAYLDERYSQSESVNFSDPCNTNNHGAITPAISSNGIQFTAVKRLERINFNNGYVLFQSSSGNRLDDSNNEDVRLDEIKIYTKINGVDTLNKTFDLEYGYFGSVNNANSIPNEYEVRLKLTKVTEKGDQGASKNPHEFTYKETVNAKYMPYRFSNSQDYWGYFNGISNPSLVPSYSYQHSNGSILLGDANRNVNGTHNYAQIGIVERITYPTKGYTEFEFENNRVTIIESGAPQQYIAGGLRVKNISSHHYDGTLQWQKSYEYVQKDNPSRSSGVYNGLGYTEPRDFFNSRQYYFSANQPGSCTWTNPAAGHSTYSVSMASTLRLVNNHGSTFYSQVKEYNGSPTNHEGYTWYEFEATKDTFVQGIGPVAFSVDRGWDRGQLVLEETYRNGNSNPIQSTSYTYEEIAVRTPIKGYKPGTRFDVQSLGYVPPQMATSGQEQTFRNNQYFLAYFEEPIIWKRLQSKTIELDGVTSTETYSYNTGNAHTNAISISTTTSKGDSRNIKTYYPDDITSVSALDGPNLQPDPYSAISKLKKNGTNRRVGQPIQSTTIENGEQSIQRTNFKDWGGNIILPENIETLKGSHSSSNTIQDRVTYHKYDNLGRPLQTSATNGRNINYLWGYNKQYLIAMIESESSYDQINTGLNTAENFNFSTIQTKSDEDNDNCTSANCKEEILRDHLNAIRENFPDAMVTTYTYDPLVGVTSVTDPRGYIMYYEYDEFNRLKLVKDADGNLVKEYKYNYKNQ